MARGATSLPAQGLEISALTVPPSTQFFHAQQASQPFYNRIRGNNTSRYISWALQTRYDDQGEMIPHAEMNTIFQTEEPEAWERFEAWKDGRTGFPWIVSRLGKG